MYASADRTITENSPNPVKVFISYKHGVHDIKKIRAIANALNKESDIEAWYDELNEDELHNAKVNALLKRYFPDVIFPLVGLRNFLQHRLEDSDIIVFITAQVPSPSPTKRRLFQQHTEKTLWNIFKYYLQLNLIIWCLMISMMVASMVFFYMAITVIFNILQNEHRPIILSLADFITSPWRRLRGYLRKKPTHRFSPLSELTHRNTQFENKFGYFMLPSRYMRSAIVYRTVYGIKMPKVSPFFYKPQKSWQEWELEAATALGLNVIKVEINVDHENQIPITENTIRLNDERLENKLSKVVLPQLKNSYRKPYQVQTGFLKFLLLLLAGLMLCLITLLFIIIVLLYSIVVGIIHYVAI